MVLFLKWSNYVPRDVLNSSKPDGLSLSSQQGPKHMRILVDHHIGNMNVCDLIPDYIPDDIVLISDFGFRFTNMFSGLANYVYQLRKAVFGQFTYIYLSLQRHICHSREWHIRYVRWHIWVMYGPNIWYIYIYIDDVVIPLLNITLCDIVIKW